MGWAMNKLTLPVQTFEMNLKRVSDTEWPLTTPVSPDMVNSR
jgi:hypothetical protein